jgi:Leucine-rich repeat (LRR) protein
VQLLEELRTKRIMNLAEVPSQFHERVSDGGKRVSLVGMQLTLVPEWLENLPMLTKLDLSDNQLASVPEWPGT